MVGSTDNLLRPTTLILAPEERVHYSDSQPVHHAVSARWENMSLRGLKSELEPFKNEKRFEQIA